MAQDPIRLTSLCSSAGCAAKMGPEALANVLHPIAGLFPEGSRPEILAGLEAGDDAAVYRLDDSRALVFTTDYFTPVVDDPFDFGAIAATNAMSDIYAMGGTPVLALNIAGFPASLPPGVISEILRGGAEAAKAAGCVVAGGHTIVAQEPTYGLAVIGFADPACLFLKTGVLPGDALVLTKPLGIGVLTTALKRGLAGPPDVDAAVASMKVLNGEAASVLAAHGVRACTDVTGFSLLGHGLELAKKSGVGLRFHVGALRFVRGAVDAAAAGAFPCGTKNNQSAFEASVRFAAGVTDQTRKLMFSPETSGGLLAAVPAGHLEACLAALSASRVDGVRIGEADAGLQPGTITVD